MKTGLKTFLTRYHPRYVRSLVYMAQQSEYRARDFARWFLRTSDFLRVEQRKTLAKTPKALILLGLLAVLAVLLLALAVWVIIVGNVWWRYLVALLFVAALPYILAVFLTALLYAWWFLQWPIEGAIMAHAHRRLSAHKAQKIAIAGSFGKTTMREILKTVLSSGKRIAAPPGSYNTPLGISSFIRGLKGNEEVLIFELGEYYPGDVMRLCKLIEPNVGIITGVNEAHLEKFRDIKRTQATIFELAEYLYSVIPASSVIPAQAGIQKGFLYINGESPLEKGGADSGRRGVVYYTRAGAGEWKVKRAQTGLAGTSFTLGNGTDTISVRSKLLGLHNIGPLCAAAHIATRLGLTPAEIERGIDATKPFEHRLEPRTDAQGVTTLDDSYNGNPDGVRAVIEFLASLRGGRRWYVTPGLVEMGSRKEKVHKEIGKQLARASIEKVILIRNSVTPFIEAGLQEEQYKGELMWFEKALDAFAALPSLTASGDIVLLQNDWPDQYA